MIKADKNMLKRLIAFGGCFGGLMVSSGALGANLPSPQNFPVGKPTLGCIYQASKDHNVPFVMLLGVNSVERGHTGQYVGNKNGTKDIGAFQINTIHLATARKYGANHEDLAKRGCYNAQFAAMLLNRALNEPRKQHLDIFTRGAGYHSWTPKYNTIYKKKLERYTLEWQNYLNTYQGSNFSNTPTAIPVTSPTSNQSNSAMTESAGITNAGYIQRKYNPFTDGLPRQQL